MNDPYTSPQSVPQPESGIPVIEPRAIKVFGILHLVFGSMGVFFGLIGLVFSFLIEPFFNWMAELMASEELLSEPGASGDVDLAAMMNAMGEMYASQQGYYIVSSLFGLVVAALMLRAGFGLVKRKAAAVKWSNLCSWAAIVMAVLSLPATLLYTLPAQKEMEEKLNESMGLPSAGEAEQIEMILSVIVSVFGVVAALIYPVLALVFLKRDKVTAFMQRLGS